MTNKTSILFLITSYLIVIILSLINCNNAFFWDTVQLGSKHASFFYYNNFNTILLPTYLDSGHIPTFGIYIATIWKIFGRSLIASHLAILPFSLGIVYQLNRLCEKFIPTNYIGIALLIILIDPTLMSQMTLVSPDIPLVFFFLLGMNSIIKENKTLLALSILFLFLISMRGMMISFTLLVLDITININLKRDIQTTLQSLIKRSIIYLPALLCFILFSSLHYYEKGWIGYHKDSPWAKCFESTDFKGFVTNIGYYGWRILDYGRIGIWLVFFILLYKYKHFISKSAKTTQLIKYFILLACFLPLNMLWAKNLMGHRYFLPIYLVFSLLTVVVLFSSFTNKKDKIILSGIFILFLISGNFWIYPQKVAKGWDSTLAHLPYYDLNKQALHFLDEKNINYNNVTSFFPNASVIDNLYLNNDLRHFDNFELTNTSSFVFYSNIFNVSNEIINTLNTKYIPIQRFEKRGVYLIIYQLKRSN